MEIEYDGIEVQEVMASCDDCQIVLTHNHVRFILVMVRPTDPTNGDIVAEWFQKIEESEMDPGEMTYERMLGGSSRICYFCLQRHDVHTVVFGASIKTGAIVSRGLSPPDDILLATFLRAWDVESAQN